MNKLFQGKIQEIETAFFYYVIINNLHRYFSFIKERYAFPYKWILGRVTKVCSGTKDLVRLVWLKRKFGKFKRPIHKISFQSIHDCTNIICYSYKYFFAYAGNLFLVKEDIGFSTRVNYKSYSEIEDLVKVLTHTHKCTIP